MRRILWVAMAIAAGCDDGGGTGGGADGGLIVLPDGGAGGAGGEGGAGDIIDDYCAGIATAKCEYVFKCVEGIARGSTFGLDGPGLDDCVATEADRCLEDARDRAQRGTIREITAVEIETCRSRMTALACPPGSPDDWVTMFYQFYGQRCTSIGTGMVPDGQACERRTDCQTRQNICDGTCRPAQASDIMQDCVATGSRPGNLNPDDSCIGETCARLVNNDVGKEGICTIDCTEGFGCPSGSYCLRSSGIGGVATWYCSWPCQADRDCQNGFQCAEINPDEPGDRHCAVRSPE